MFISEEERREILSKYNDDTSEELLIFLKRYFPVHETKLDWIEKPLKFISIDGKIRPLENNKKYLVSKIYNSIENQWISLGTQVMRRTIKKYLDGVMMP